MSEKDMTLVTLWHRRGVDLLRLRGAIVFADVGKSSEEKIEAYVQYGSSLNPANRFLLARVTVARAEELRQRLSLSARDFLPDELVK